MDDLKKAIRSSFSGFKAMTIQVCKLMWVRTIMNLYKQGGVKRFYSGLLQGLIQGPVSRFGETFSNSLALKIMKRT